MIRGVLAASAVLATAAVAPLAVPLSAQGAPSTAPATASATARLTSRGVLRLLGLPDTARVVIIHADDAALTPGTDRVTLAALRAKQISSASVLASTSQLGSFAQAISADTALDLGVHLALTSETSAMRIPAAAPARQVRSLVDAEGLLPLGVPRDAKPAEIERELDAQLALVRAAGIRPTHLDSHQGALLFHGAERFGALRRVAKRNCLQIPLPESFFGRFPYLADALDDGFVPLADLMSIDPEVAAADWEAHYIALFETMRPGVTLLLVHLSEDTPAERALFREHVEYDAAWRARDAALVRSGALREMARWHGITVISWRELARVSSLCRPQP